MIFASSVQMPSSHSLLTTAICLLFKYLVSVLTTSKVIKNLCEKITICVGEFNIYYDDHTLQFRKKYISHCRLVMK